MWSKDAENIEAERIFLEYVEKGLFGFSSLMFAATIFDGIVNDLNKRRDYVNKKLGGVSALQDDDNLAIYERETKKLTKESKSDKNEAFLIDNINIDDYAFKENIGYSNKRTQRGQQYKPENLIKKNNQNVISLIK